MSFSEMINDLEEKGYEALIEEMVTSVLSSETELYRKTDEVRKARNELMFCQQQLADLVAHGVRSGVITDYDSDVARVVYVKGSEVYMCKIEFFPESFKLDIKIANITDFKNEADR